MPLQLFKINSHINKMVKLEITIILSLRIPKYMLKFNFLLQELNHLKYFTIKKQSICQLNQFKFNLIKLKLISITVLSSILAFSKIYKEFQ